jgi:hypothetical protein
LKAFKKEAFLVKHLLRQLTITAAVTIVFNVLCGAIAHATTIDFSGTIIGTASIDPAGRCGSAPTENITGTGVATILGDFVDVQSHCITSESSLDDGMFEFTSVSNPDDSLIGTYFAVASSQDGMLDFTAILLATGGTGVFADGFGAIFGLGTLDEGTAALSQSFSGQLETTTPEPGTGGLIGIAFGALWILRVSIRQRYIQTRRRTFCC